MPQDLKLSLTQDEAYTLVSTNDRILVAYLVTAFSKKKARKVLPIAHFPASAFPRTIVGERAIWEYGDMGIYSIKCHKCHKYYVGLLGSSLYNQYKTFWLVDAPKWWMPLWGHTY